MFTAKTQRAQRKTKVEKAENEKSKETINRTRQNEVVGLAGDAHSGWGGLKGAKHYGHNSRWL